MPAKKGGPDNPPFAYCRGAVAFVTAFLHPFFHAGPGSYRKLQEDRGRLDGAETQNRTKTGQGGERLFRPSIQQNTGRLVSA